MPDKRGSFSLAQGERDGLPYFLGVREKFKKFEDKDNLPWFLKIEVNANANELGLVSDEEGEVLNKFEDFIEERIHPLTKIYFVARITWNGIRSLYYYVSNPKSTSESLEGIMSKNLYPREFKYEIVKDPDWKKMSEIIPNIEKF